MNKSLISILGLLLLFPACWATQPHQPLRTVEFVDLDRYLGQWHEIFRMPNRFQRRCVTTQAIYERRSEKMINVTNVCQTNEGRTQSVRGRAKIADRVTKAKLKVSFIPVLKDLGILFPGDYWILALASDHDQSPYSFALVGTPDRKFLWLLSRDSRASEAVVNYYQLIAQSLGFATDNLVFSRAE